MRTEIGLSADHSSGGKIRNVDGAEHRRSSSPLSVRFDFGVRAADGLAYCGRANHFGTQAEAGEQSRVRRTAELPNCRTVELKCRFLVAALLGMTILRSFG